MIHKHIFKDPIPGFGELPKNNTPGLNGFNGYVAKCECGIKMFFPDDPRLAPVEIEMEGDAA